MGAAHLSSLDFAAVAGARVGGGTWGMLVEMTMSSGERQRRRRSSLYRHLRSRCL